MGLKALSGVRMFTDLHAEGFGYAVGRDVVMRGANPAGCKKVGVFPA